MSFLIGSGPDTDKQKQLEQGAQQAVGLADPNVHTVDFGTSALGGMGAQGRNAQLAAIQGYQDIINAPGGLDAKARAALTGTRLSTDAETNAKINDIQQQAARRGTGSAGEAAAEQAMADSAGANRNAAAGTNAAALGEEARQAALTGEAATGGAIRGADVNAARTTDAYTLANKENQQKMLEENFQNALAKASGYNQVQSAYNGTAAGGGYGLMKGGLLSPQNLSGALQAVGGAMTGGLSTLATSAIGGLSGMLGGGGGGGPVGGSQAMMAAGPTDNSEDESLGLNMGYNP